MLCDEAILTSAALLCGACDSDLHRVGPSCSICSAGIMDGQLGQVCGECQKNPPWFNSSDIPLNYSFPVNTLIKGLKYKDKLIYSKILADLMITHLENRKQTLPECIVPVPLHPIRLMHRGFNQSQLISREIGKSLSCPVDDTCCQRIKHTQQQTGMKKKQREQNIRQAFSVKKPLRYKHIAIVDDVITTGSTVNELARLFKQAGVETVEIWACAKANIVDQ